MSERINDPMNDHEARTRVRIRDSVLGGLGWVPRKLNVLQSYDTPEGARDERNHATAARRLMSGVASTGRSHQAARADVKQRSDRLDMLDEHYQRRAKAADASDMQVDVTMREPHGDLPAMVVVTRGDDMLRMSAATLDDCARLAADVAEQIVIAREAEQQ